MNEKDLKSLLSEPPPQFNGDIPQEMPYNGHDCFGINYDPVDTTKNLQYKFACNDAGMYAHVSWKWVIPFASWISERKCLEVMAGAGHLSFALKKLGINIITTDDLSWQELKKWTPVTEIEQLTANKAIRKYGKDVDIVIMAWPYMDSYAYQALKMLYIVNPNALVIYIGEGEGGCTADDRFFEHWDEIEDERLKEAQTKYERFFGMHDRIELGRYKIYSVRMTGGDD